MVVNRLDDTRIRCRERYLNMGTIGGVKIAGEAGVAETEELCEKSPLVRVRRDRLDFDASDQLGRLGVADQIAAAGLGVGQNDQADAVALLHQPGSWNRHDPVTSEC